MRRPKQAMCCIVDGGQRSQALPQALRLLQQR